MRLTVKDVSSMLGVSKKTVYRWMNERKLPGYRVSGQYRFNRAEILAWSTHNKVNLSPDALHEHEDDDQPLPTLEEALVAGGIHYRVAGYDQATALRGVVNVLSLPDELDREYLWQLLLVRERMASTGIGDGIAIPHTRNPVVLHVPRASVSLCFLEQPIEFGALDGKPVVALFTLISPTVRAHLHLLSRFSFALRDAEFKSLIHNQAGREPLLNALKRIQETLPSVPVDNGEIKDEIL